MLKVNSIETAYGSSQVLFGLSLEVQEGQVVTLMGRNGMGKTTTVRSIMGQARTHGGSITFNGVEITKMEDYKIAQLGLGLVPEGRQIFPNLTVRENLVATAHNRSVSNDPWILGKVLELLQGLAERRDAMGNQLSGGEQQRVAVARSLVMQQALLLADEPTGDLDEKTAESLDVLIHDMHRKYGLTSLIATHNPRLAESCDRVLRLEEGVLRAE